MDRRAFLAAGSLAASAPALAAMPRRSTQGDAAGDGLFTRVDFNSDGLALDPREYASLLKDAAFADTIQPDNYSLGGFVEALEQDFAKRLGKEAAMFVPTGTLANHLAVRTLAGGDRRVLVQADSHLFSDSGDGATVLSGLNLIPLAGHDGAISIESPVRRHGHQFVDPAELQRISTFARARGIRLHLDGARLFNLPRHSGQDIRAITAMFDTVYVSLWKHFNAATGAILAGTRAVIDGLFHARRMFGGALPHAWQDIALVPGFVETYEADYARAWTTAEALFARLSASGRFAFTTLPRGTSRVGMTLTGTDPALFSRRLADAGIRLQPPHPESGGFALQVNTSLLRRSPDALAEAFLRAAG